MNRFVSVLALSGVVSLAGCVAPTPKPNDPYYAPVLPRTPLPAAANNGSIYQAGFEQNLYSDRKAYRVGDIITITLNEKTQASKNANSQIGKNSKADIGLTSFFGGGLSTNDPIGSGDLSLDVGYSGERATKGDSKAAQGNNPDRFDHRYRGRCLAQRHHRRTRREVDDAQHWRRTGADCRSRSCR